jgi:hypothetical protein
MLSKFLQLVKLHKDNFFLAFCIILIAFTTYNLGRINSSEKGIITVSEKDIRNGTAAIFDGGAETTPSADQKRLDTRVVASKLSTSNKYHYTWCSGAKRIKEENKLWFNSAQEAESRGYTLAGNCQ